MPVNLNEWNDIRPAEFDAVVDQCFEQHMNLTRITSYIREVIPLNVHMMPVKCSFIIVNDIFQNLFYPDLLHHFVELDQTDVVGKIFNESTHAYRGVCDPIDNIFA